MSETTRLRITSDGTPGGTRVITEDGTLVKGVQLVAWHLGIGEFARCMLEVRAVAVDLVGEYEGSMPEDPTAIVVLAEPQDPPEGPGFVTTGYATFEPGYVCPACGAPYHDPQEICAGTDESGEHIPTSVVEREVPHEPEGA